MKSMTAYAYGLQEKGLQSAKVIIRSTNYRYLEIFVYNLSGENILLEEAIKKEIKSKISRGRIEVHVFLKYPLRTVLTINEANLKEYIVSLKKISKKYNLKGELSINNIINLPHIVSWREKETSKTGLIIAAFKTALARLIEFKEREGTAIHREISQNLRGLKSNANKIKSIKPKARDEGDNSKEDIDEEISLISFYISRLENKIKARKIQSLGKPIDFLTQEILRELNAASSKTKNRIVANLIVESKNFLERVREQAQNIE